MDTEQDEKQLQKERYDLANSINESSNFIFSLINKLSYTQDKERAAVMADMMVDEYLAARAMVEEYKKLGGEYYSIDRGLWRYVMGY